MWLPSRPDPSKHSCVRALLWQLRLPHPQTPGRIQKVDPPQRSVIYHLHHSGVFKSRFGGGSTFWILLGVGVTGLGVGVPACR